MIHTAFRNKAAECHTDTSCYWFYFRG